MSKKFQIKYRIRIYKNFHIFPVSNNLTASTAREEAAATVIGHTMYVLGGIIGDEVSNTVEMWDHSDETARRKSGPVLPEGRARFCAVPFLDLSAQASGSTDLRFPEEQNGHFLAVIGGE